MSVRPSHDNGGGAAGHRGIVLRVHVQHMCTVQAMQMNTCTTCTGQIEVRSLIQSMWAEKTQMVYKYTICTCIQSHVWSNLQYISVTLHTTLIHFLSDGESRTSNKSRTVKFRFKNQKILYVSILPWVFLRFFWSFFFFFVLANSFLWNYLTILLSWTIAILLYSCMLCVWKTTSQKIKKKIEKIKWKNGGATASLSALFFLILIMQKVPTIFIFLMKFPFLPAPPRNPSLIQLTLA